MPIAPLLAPKRPAPQPTNLIKNVVATNRALVGQIYSDVCMVSSHPFASLESMGWSMVWPLIHPIRACQYAWQNMQDDPLGGSLDAASTATGEAYVGLVIVAGAATVFVPGGSAIAEAALGIADSLGYACVGLDAAGMALYELEGANAKTEADAADAGSSIASYLEDEAICIGTWKMGDAVQSELFQPNATIGWVTADTIGLPGVYDPPPAPEGPGSKQS
ncbi:MAG TPA: hypothetical protein V6D47_22180 [Oscillatoriaceae cyanobacterium]